MSEAGFLLFLPAGIHHEDDGHGDQASRATDGPHENPAQLLLLNHGHSPESLQRAVGVEQFPGKGQGGRQGAVGNGRGEQDHHPHQEIQAGREGIGRDDVPPEQRRAKDEAGMFQIVQPFVAQGRVVEPREVPGHEQEDEQGEGHQGMGDEQDEPPHPAVLRKGNKYSAPHHTGQAPHHGKKRGAQQQQGYPDHHQQLVLHHVEREGIVRQKIDRTQQRQRDHPHSAQIGNGTQQRESPAPQGCPPPPQGAPPPPQVEQGNGHHH